MSSKYFVHDPSASQTGGVQSLLLKFTGSWHGYLYDEKSSHADNAKAANSAIAYFLIFLFPVDRNQFMMLKPTQCDLTNK